LSVSKNNSYQKKQRVFHWMEIALFREKGGRRPSLGGLKVQSCDLGAKRSCIDTTKVNKNFENPNGWTCQKWHNLRWKFSKIFLFLFLRFFQIFYTKMFPQTFSMFFTSSIFFIHTNFIDFLQFLLTLLLSPSNSFQIFQTVVSGLSSSGWF
jgi:hypothetical protein